MEDSVLTLKEVASMVRLSTQTIRVLRRQRRFPEPFNIGTRRLGWQRSTIEAWIAAGGASVQRKEPKPKKPKPVGAAVVLDEDLMTLPF